MLSNIVFQAPNSSAPSSKRSLPPLRSLFHTPSAADFLGSLPRSSRIPGSSNSVDLPIDPSISIVEKTYQELRRREEDTRRPGDGELVVHEDFVSRDAKFEVDA